MSRSARVVVVILLVFLAGGTAFADTTGAKPAWPAYALSLLLGFGSGQSYLGTNGIGFLVGDCVGIGTVAAGGLYVAIALWSGEAALLTGSGPSETDFMTSVTVGYGIMIAGLAVWAVSRVWEVIDTFGTAGRLTDEGRLVVAPAVEVSPTGATTVALSFRY